LSFFLYSQSTAIYLRYSHTAFSSQEKLSKSQELYQLPLKKWSLYASLRYVHQKIASCSLNASLCNASSQDISHQSLILSSVKYLLLSHVFVFIIHLHGYIQFVEGSSTAFGSSFFSSGSDFNQTLSFMFDHLLQLEFLMLYITSTHSLARFSAVTFCLVAVR
jgi:hypothetical protein